MLCKNQADSANFFCTICLVFAKKRIIATKENTACTEPLAKAAADVALIQEESYTF